MPAESKVLERAEQYIRKLSIGVNPLSGEALPEGDACRQERIGKCLAYVADYLQQRLVPKASQQAVKKNPKREARNRCPYPVLCVGSMRSFPKVAA